MTSAARDLSSYDGAPITLYQFTRKSKPTSTGVEVITNWRYTSHDEDYEYGGFTWTAAAISDDGIRQNGDATADQLTFTMPVTLEVPQMFVGSPPSDTIFALILRTHHGETDAFNGWNGSIGQVSRKSDLTVEIMCDTLSATLDRQGLRLSWMRGCPHDLYGFECRVNPLDFMETATLDGVNHVILQSSTFAGHDDGWWVGGFVEWIDTYGHAERRGIISHTGDTVRVMGGTEPLEAGATVFIFPGCFHNTTDCASRFSNLPNYGGHAYMVDVSPFAQTLIW